jgi:sarcosine oxidase
MIYDYLVVGRGLMGSAAAKHLSRQGYAVALIGPGEPADWTTHRGVFASHYDEGRITRILDPNLHWAQFAQRSIARYRPLEAQTGIRFYGEVGHLAVGEPEGESGKYLAALQKTADQLGVSIEVLDGQDLRSRFPYFYFKPSAMGFYQSQQAGYISPRSHVAAQSRAVELNGGTIITEMVQAIHPEANGITVETKAHTLQAKAGIVATGGFTKASGLVPPETPLEVQGRTILLAQVRQEDLSQLKGMPSLIHRPNNSDQRFYLLPPIQYPDGNWYLKLGCSHLWVLRDDLMELRHWFQSSGDSATVDHLQRLLKALMPEIIFVSFKAKTCVTTHTPSGYPIIDWVQPGRLVSLVGGNGYAGKSADELGWIAAQLLSQGRWTYDLPAHLFHGKG